MGLMDLFKPKWKRSDPEVRKAAVEKIDDQNILAKIVRNDNDGNVRYKAVEKLTDQQLLSDIARDDVDKYVRSRAAENITDRKILEDLAISSSDEKIRKMAVDIIEDQKLLAKIEKEDSDEELARIAKIGNSNEVLNAAFDKITDLEVICDIGIKESGYIYWLCEEAKEKIKQAAKNSTDEKMLAMWSRVIESTNYSKACDIVETFTNPQILFEVAIKSNKEHVGKTALDKITDQSVLAEIGKTANNYHVAHAAVSRITDIDILNELVKNPEKDWIRKVANRTLREKRELYKTYFCQQCGNKQGHIKVIEGSEYSFCSNSCQNQFGSALTNLMYKKIAKYKSVCRHCGSRIDIHENFSQDTMICKSCGKRNT